MKKDGFNFAFADELYRDEYDEPFKRLSMSNNKYFNAGVMIANLNYWKKEKLTYKSLDLIDKIKEKAKFWDQDILNSIIDGEYLSLDKNLNFRTGGKYKKRNKNDIIFIHYSGKSKPWDVGGVFEDLAMEYHYFYKKLTNKTFHVVVKNRKNSLRKIYRNLETNNEIKIMKLSFYVLKSIIKIIKK